MKFKKLILPFLLVLMLMPFMVNAETCNLGKITIDSVTINEKTNNVIEIEQPVIEEETIKINLKMIQVNDSIEYKMNIKNDSSEDYKLNENNFNANSNYIKYTLRTDDDSLVVKAGTAKKIYLKIQYINEVPDTIVTNGQYNDKKNLTFNLSNTQTIGVLDIIKNPKTGNDSFIVFISMILIISLIIFVLLRKKKRVKYLVLVIIATIIIPFSVYAICNYKIEIVSNITIEPKPSITDTIYWALQDTDLDEKNDKLVISNSSITGNKEGNFSVDTVFSSVTEVPWMRDNEYFYYGSDESKNYSYNVSYVEIEGIVVPKNLDYWFAGVGQGVESLTINLTNLKTCYVTSMKYMFNYTGMNSNYLEIEGINNLDTSEVTNMSGMFEFTGDSIETMNIDLSNWNTSKVTDMSYMFDATWMQAKSWSVGDIGKWDTSNVVDMNSMFCQAGMYSTEVDLDVNRWDTSNVVDMNNMFNSFGHNLPTFDMDLTSWNTSSLQVMYNMFVYTGYNSTTFNLDLSTWDTSNVTNMGGMFQYTGYNSTKFNLDISGWNTSKDTKLNGWMFSGTAPYATDFTITIPKTNGNGLNNTTSKMYGSTISYYAAPPRNRLFTLAS